MFLCLKHRRKVGPGQGVSAFLLTLKYSRCLFIMTCTTAPAGLSPPPNQTGEVCFLLQHWACHQFVLTKLQSEVLEFRLVCYCWGPEGTKKLSHLFSQLCPRPAPVQCSPAVRGQAEEGTAVRMTCEEPCWGPSLHSAAEFQFHPHLCSMPVLSCRCQHLQSVTHLCCGSPCSSSRVAGSFQEPGNISQHTIQGNSQAWQMPQAPSSLATSTSDPQSVPAVWPTSTPALFDCTIQFQRAAKVIVWGRRALMAHDGLGLTRAPTAVSIAITLCPCILDSCCYPTPPHCFLS